jgi:hypothetical protein
VAGVAAFNGGGVAPVVVNEGGWVLQLGGGGPTAGTPRSVGPGSDWQAASRPQRASVLVVARQHG